jgi:hypothetical protein
VRQEKEQFEREHRWIRVEHDRIKRDHEQLTSLGLANVMGGPGIMFLDHTEDIMQIFKSAIV